MGCAAREARGAPHFLFFCQNRLTKSKLAPRHKNKKMTVRKKNRKNRVRAGAGPAPRPMHGACIYTPRRPAPPPRAPEFGVFCWGFLFRKQKIPQKGADSVSTSQGRHFFSLQQSGLRFPGGKTSFEFELLFVTVSQKTATVLLKPFLVDCAS